MEDVVVAPSEFALDLFEMAVVVVAVVALELPLFTGLPIPAPPSSVSISTRLTGDSISVSSLPSLSLLSTSSGLGGNDLSLLRFKYRIDKEDKSTT